MAEFEIGNGLKRRKNIFELFFSLIEKQFTTLSLIEVSKEDRNEN